MIKTYISRPTKKQAVQWDGSNFDEIKEFVENKLIFNKIENNYDLKITTLEGDEHVSINDFIVKGIKGEFYPGKPDVFKKSYIELTEI